jgi:hypothetical protein
VDGDQTSKMARTDAFSINGLNQSRSIYQQGNESSKKGY